MQYLKYSKIFLPILIMIFISACTDVAMTGAQAVYNRRSITKNFNDQYISMQAFKAIHTKDARFQNTNIAIATFNKEVLLAGQAPYAWQKVEAEKIVRRISGVDKIYNLISLSSPSSTLTRVSDAWITGKVKAKLMASDDLDSQAIKVVTENGTVYLMGSVKPEEAQAAVDLARETTGVTSVVKIFSYVYVSKKPLNLSTQQMS